MTRALDAYVHLFRPGRGAGSQILVLLHGTGDDEQGFSRLAEHLAPDAGVASIRGSVSERSMNRFFRREAEGVYDMADLAKRTGELIAFVKAAAERYGLERNGLVGVGYSNGANTLANALFHDAAVVEGALLLHPLIPFEPPANPGLAGKRILISAGARDPIWPPHLSRALLAYFQRQGAAATLRFHQGGHELAQEEIADARSFVEALGKSG